MALIPLPEEEIWANFKPDFPVELDPNHPLTNRFISYSLLNEPGSSQLDMVSGQLSSGPNTVGYISPIGRAVNLSKVSASPTHYATWGNNSRFYPQTPFTAFVHMSLYATDGNYCSVYGIPITSATNSAQSWSFFKTNTNTITFSAAYGSSSTGVSSSLVLGATPVFYIATWDGANIRLYVNGVLVATTALTTPPNIVTEQFMIGSNTTYLTCAQANLYSVGLLNGAISATQALSLSQKPYQFLRPKSRDIWVSVGGNLSISAAITESPDTASANVSPIVAFSGADVEPTDNMLSDVSVIVSISSATTDTDDVLAANVAPLSATIDFSSATTDSPDAWVVNTGPIVSFSSATTDSIDVLSAASQPIVGMSAIYTDQIDTAVVNINPIVGLSSASIDQIDVWNAQATSIVGVSAAYTDSLDSLTAQVFTGNSTADGSYIVLARHQAKR